MRKRGHIPHGTLSRYMNRGCRCLPCKRARAIYDKGKRDHLRRSQKPPRTTHEKPPRLRGALTQTVIRNAQLREQRREQRMKARALAVEKRAKEQAKKDPLAVALGRRGGLKGGKARAASLTPDERSRSARIAARARWDHRG